MRTDDLSLLRLKDPVLPAFRSLWPVGRVLPVQQHDVKVLSLRDVPQLVELGLRVSPLVEGSHLAHQLIAVARQPFKRLSQHSRCLVGLGRLKEANAAIVSIAHQPGELLLPQRSLYRTAVRSSSEGQAGHVHFLSGQAQRYQSPCASRRPTAKLLAS